MHGTRNAETDDAGPDGLRGPHARRGAQHDGAVLPAAAAHDTHGAVAVERRSAVRRSQIVGIMPEIGSPFPHVAVHIVKAESVWRKVAGRNGACAKAKSGAGGIDAVAARIARDGAGAACVFPLRFGKNAVALLSRLREPLCERLRLVP